MVKEAFCVDVELNKKNKDFSYCIYLTANEDSFRLNKIENLYFSL